MTDCWRAVRVLFFLALLLPAARAQADAWPSPDPEKRVGIDARFDPARTSGGSVRFEVRVTTSPGWHIYSLQETFSMPSTLDLEVPGDWTLEGGWQEPQPRVYPIEGLDEESLIHEGQVTFHVNLVIPEVQQGGEVVVKGSLEYQVCNDQECLLPTKVPFQARLTLARAGAVEPAARPEEVERPAIQIHRAHNFGAAATVSPARLPPGGVAALRVHFEVLPLWHIYPLHGDDEYTYYTNFAFPDWPAGIGFEAGSEWTGPEPIATFTAGEAGLGHEGHVVFERAVKVDSTVPPGEYTLEGTASAMACSHEQCMRPGTFEVSARLVVDAAAPAPAVVPTVKVSSAAPDRAPEEGSRWLALLSLIGVAAGGAMFSWLMPCVYPMIPINISFFGKIAEEKRAGRTRVASAYGLGIAGTFVLLGVIVGVLSMVFTESATDFALIGNKIATNVWLNIFIGVTFVFFALSMFGLFEIRLPSFLINKADRAGRSSGSAVLGSVLLGVTFALVSFSCTVPIVGLLLVQAISGTAAGLTSALVGMTVYGVVFAAPFVLLSLFPAAVQNLPRAGGWMETVKVGFGFLELAAALKFLWVPDQVWSWGLLTRPVVLVLFTVIVLATAAFFLGLLQLGHGPKVKALRVGKGRLILAGLTLGVLVPLLVALSRGPRYDTGDMPYTVSMLMEAVLPPPPSDDELARHEGWFVDDYDSALKKAREQDLPLFLDFTGVFCPNCRTMEYTVFPQEPVQKLFDQMVLCRLYVDRKEDKHEGFARMQVERFARASQPYYVLLDARNEESLAERGFCSVEEFEQVFSAGLKEFRARRDVGLVRAGDGPR